MDVDHMLDDFDRRDIPDEVRELFKFFLENVWQVWATLSRCVVTKVLDGIAESLVDTVASLASVGFITFTEKIGCGKRGPEEECWITPVLTILGTINWDFSFSDDKFSGFNGKSIHFLIVGVLIEFNMSWGFDVLGSVLFKHNPESPWLFRVMFSLTGNIFLDEC